MSVVAGVEEKLDFSTNTEAIMQSPSMTSVLSMSRCLHSSNMSSVGDQTLIITINSVAGLLVDCR